METRPIIFGADSVRAILDERKTQTRRVIKQAGNDYVLWFHQLDGPGEVTFTDNPLQGEKGNILRLKCPYGQPGDRLWVREGFIPNYFNDGKPGYKADWTKLAAGQPGPRRA